MSASYELWLTDDASRRLLLLNKVAFFSYSRTLSGYGALELGIPYKEISKHLTEVFRPDWRVEIWRSPGVGFPMRMERTYLLRQVRIYTRETDNVMMVVYYGRDGIDLLRRRSIIQVAGLFDQTTMTDPIDDIMKEVVYDSMFQPFALDENSVLDPDRGYPLNEFLVQSKRSLGPTVTMSFADRVVLDILKELKELSFTLNSQDSANRRIFFDVVERNFETAGAFLEIGRGHLRTVFEFATFADRRGADRREGRVFSIENENIRAPVYSKDFSDEVNFVYVKGNGRGASRAVEIVQDSERVAISRWNRQEVVRQVAYETTDDGLISAGNFELEDGKPIEKIELEFLNTPGSKDSPRSLYGLDWDLGDTVPVEFANMRFECDVAIVHVSVNEDGNENVLGRNTL